MAGLLLTFLLLGQDFRTQLQPTATSVSLEVTAAKAALETIAGAAGLNVIFDPEFMDSPASMPVHIENGSILDALDTVSKETHCFYEVLDGHSIVVAADTPAKHTQYDTQIIKPYFVTTGPANLVTIVSFLRIRLPARFISQSVAAGAVILRENRTHIDQAEKMIAGLAQPKAGVLFSTAASNALGHVQVSDSNGIRTIKPNRGQLQLSAARPFAFKMTDTTQALFEAVARAAGLTVIFDREFRSAGGVVFDVKNVDALDALDLLSLQTRNMWHVLDEKTILVAPDTPAKRRDLESLIVKTFTLNGDSPAVRLGEIVTTLRTLLGLRFVSGSASANTIMIRATPVEMSLAEVIIDDLKDPAGHMIKSTEISSGTETEPILKRRAARQFSTDDAYLQNKSKNPITLETKPNVRGSYEDLARLMGLQVVFDKAFQDASAQPIRLQSVSASDALDFLSLHTGHLWRLMQPDTIVVMPDNDVTRGAQPKASSAVNVKNLTAARIAELANAVKTLFGFAQVEPAANGIQITDTQENISIAEKIVPELARPLSE